MPNLNPKDAGDNFYPQYNRVTSESVSAITIKKGRLYTKGSASATGNQLVAPAASGFINGIYQATRAIVVAGTAGEHSVQCYGPGSRIGIPAKDANLHRGQLVKYNIATHDVSLWSGTTGGVTPNEYAGKVGRIFEIYSKDDITVEKDVTEADDMVIVEVGQG